MDNRIQNQDNNTDATNNRQGGRPAAGSREEPRHFTQIDNAHAAGLGSMGRNDEKLPNAEDAENGEPEPNY